MTILENLDALNEAKANLAAVEKDYRERFGNPESAYISFFENNIGKSFKIFRGHYIKILEQHKYNKKVFRCEYLCVGQNKYLTDFTRFDMYHYLHSTKTESISYNIIDFDVQTVMNRFGNLKNWKVLKEFSFEGMYNIYQTSLITAIESLDEQRN